MANRKAKLACMRGEIAGVCLTFAVPAKPGNHNHRRFLEQKLSATVPNREAADYVSLLSQGRRRTVRREIAEVCVRFPRRSLPATNAKRLRTGAKVTKQSIFDLAMPSNGLLRGIGRAFARWLAMTALNLWRDRKTYSAASTALVISAVPLRPPNSIG